MILFYLRGAFRNLWRNPFYSLINIGCLAVGLAVSMTILLYVLHEHSYDRWQANADRTFSTWGTFHFGNSEWHSGALTYVTGPMLEKEDRNVESYVRTWQAYKAPVVQNAAKPIEVTGADGPFLFADAGFFRFFSYRMLKGSPEQVLRRPNTVVVTLRAARKYFGSADPIGQVLLYDKVLRLEVTGVAADPPSNTGLDFDFIGSLAGAQTNPLLQQPLQAQTPGGGNFATWFRLKDASAAPEVAGTLTRMARSVGQDEVKTSFELVPLTQGHLFGRERGLGNYLDIFPYVAGLVLLLAMINYMSLATARAALRSREVGVRKVMGAGRSTIAGQFYTESAFFAVLSFGLGFLLFWVFRPVFLHLLQLKIDSAFLWTPVVAACFTGLLVMTIAVSGSYPSLVLSAFKPVAVLYGKLSRRRGGERVRKGFIVFQFSISMILMLCSVVVEKELYLIRHADTGVDRENIVMIRFGTTLPHYQAFKREVQALPGVRGAATAHYPMYGGYDLWSAQVKGSDKQMMLSILDADNDFPQLLGLQWKTPPPPTAGLYDGKHILLNEQAVAKLGLGSDVIGRRLQLGSAEFQVGGVLKDFVYGSLKNEVGALGLFVGGDTARRWGTTSNGWMFVKVNAHVNLPTLIASLRSAYGKYDHDLAFEYQFLDEAFDKVYKAEDRLAGLMGLFTGITIVIACMGLFALATFAAQQRVKEIGIRKVLGASVASIGGLLSRDFLRPVLLAVVIACPVSWWLMRRWLDNFVHRTSLSWWVFAVSGAGLLGVALVTVLTRSLRAAQANPIKNLRTE
ncbi:MAG TPA: ABC transporter permease [Puia sp.]|uniref:ABC transporter permease n=1 Tax=Puia sp. TaxID=2045100 RepID=UPI002C9A1750|nr:ABC transporter permease [Puia sp.]HVU94666.1 ABC transporter permease [Puia sp.]